jgi:hypothetical protein
VTNSKSAVLLKPVKEVKRTFLVQTKPKENNAASTINLRRQSSPGSKLTNLTQGTAILSRTAVLPRIASKKTIKPYFPSIASHKQPLKLN